MLNFNFLARKRTAVIGAVASLAVLAAACGGGNGYSSSSGSPTTAATNAAPTAQSSASNPAAAAGGAYDYGDTSTTSPAAGTASSALTVANGAKGNVLAGANGMTLYIFKKDTAGDGKSTCSGSCAATWPPLTATTTPAAPSGATGTFGLIMRDDGTQQVTYKGQPLYYYAGDKAAGDTNGEGLNGVWFVAAP